jgi:hypothetical protein
MQACTGHTVCFVSGRAVCRAGWRPVPGSRHQAGLARARRIPCRAVPGSDRVKMSCFRAVGLFTSIPSTIYIPHTTASQAIGNDLTDEFMVVYLNL